MTHPIPTDAQDDRLAIVGTAGSGKTYAAGTAIERILRGGNRVIVVDPLGVWWGLRLKPDGETASRFNVVIFGGPHGDLPITENAGALIGETVAAMAESCILDLSQLGTKAAERRFMLAFLTALYRKFAGDLVHIVFDEADMFAPQQLLDKEGEAPKLLGMMETLVRRGRVRGFIPWLITQRPAVLSKNVLSQADGLIAFKLTSSQDRDAIGDWVQGQADKAQWKEMWGSLATMQQGQGLIWIPGRGILDTVQFPAKKTFDSSRAPKRGEKRLEMALKPLDLAALKGRLSTIEAEATANDPRLLRRRIAELESATRKAAATAAPAYAPPSPAELAERERIGFETGRATGYRAAWAAANDQAAALFSKIPADIRAALDEFKRLANLPVAEIAPPANKAGRQIGSPGRPAIPARKETPAYPSPVFVAYDGVDEKLGGERKLLAVLASSYPAGLTEAQWATIAGLKRTGGTWGTYKSRLRSRGLIKQSGDLWFATETGLAICGPVESLPSDTPEERLAMWAQKVGGGAGRLLHALARRYPGAASRDELAGDVRMEASGGSFGTYLSRLRSNGLVEAADAGFRISPAIME